MKIKVINLKAFVEEESGNKYTAHGPTTMGVIEGPQGTIISFNDAFHELKTEPDIDIPVPVVLNDGEIKVMPEGFGQEKLDVLLKHSSTTEQPLFEFIERFGSRVESNIKKLKNSIKEVGLNPDDFE